MHAHRALCNCRFLGGYRIYDFCVLLNSLLQGPLLEQGQVTDPIKLGLGVLDGPPGIGTPGNRRQAAMKLFVEGEEKASVLIAACLALLLELALKLGNIVRLCAACSTTNDFQFDGLPHKMRVFDHVHADMRNQGRPLWPDDDQAGTAQTYECLADWLPADAKFVGNILL